MIAFMYIFYSCNCPSLEVFSLCSLNGIKPIVWDKNFRLQLNEFRGINTPVNSLRDDLKSFLTLHTDSDSFRVEGFCKEAQFTT